MSLQYLPSEILSEVVSLIYPPEACVRYRLPPCRHSIMAKKMHMFLQYRLICKRFDQEILRQLFGSNGGDQHVEIQVLPYNSEMHARILFYKLTVAQNLPGAYAARVNDLIHYAKELELDQTVQDIVFGICRMASDFHSGRKWEFRRAMCFVRKHHLRHCNRECDWMGAYAWCSLDVSPPAKLDPNRAKLALAAYFGDVKMLQNTLLFASWSYPLYKPELGYRIIGSPLWAAFKSRDVEKARVLAKSGERPTAYTDATTNDHVHLLDIALDYATDDFAKILRDFRIPIHTRLEKGFDFENFITAVKAGRLKTVLVLLECLFVPASSEGACVSISPTARSTLLQAAIEADLEDFALLLIQKGIDYTSRGWKWDPKTCDEYIGCPEFGQPLVTAIEKKQRKIVSALIEDGAILDPALEIAKTINLAELSPNEITEFLQTPANGQKTHPLFEPFLFSRRPTALATAAGQGDLALVKRLVSAGANIDARCSDAPSPLLNACLYGHGELARYLLELGACTATLTQNAVIKPVNTPLAAAASRDDIDLVAVLLDYGANPNVSHADDFYDWTAQSRTEDFVSPLGWACYNGNLAMVKLLLGKGANFWYSGLNSNVSPVELANIRGHTHIVPTLMAEGAPDPLQAGVDFEYVDWNDFEPDPIHGPKVWDDSLHFNCVFGSGCKAWQVKVA